MSTPSKPQAERADRLDEAREAAYLEAKHEAAKGTTFLGSYASMFNFAFRAGWDAAIAYAEQRHVERMAPVVEALADARAAATPSGTLKRAAAGEGRDG